MIYIGTSDNSYAHFSDYLGGNLQRGEKCRRGDKALFRVGGCHKSNHYFHRKRCNLCLSEVHVNA
jgi:hypothetical protein